MRFVHLFALATSAAALTVGVAPSRPRGRVAPLRCKIGDTPRGFLSENELGDWVGLKKSNDLGASTVKELPEAARALVAKVQAKESVTFDETMTAIDESFDSTPVAFKVGTTESGDGENMGSAKIFSFGKIAGLTEEEVLSLFGGYYQDVKVTPDGTDHQNIRQFMQVGWSAVEFSWGLPLSPKLVAYEAGVDEALARSQLISGASEWDTDSEIWIP